MKKSIETILAIDYDNKFEFSRCGPYGVLLAQLSSLRHPKRPEIQSISLYLIFYFYSLVFVRVGSESSKESQS